MLRGTSHLSKHLTDLPLISLQAALLSINLLIISLPSRTNAICRVNIQHTYSTAELDKFDPT